MCIGRPFSLMCEGYQAESRPFSESIIVEARAIGDMQSDTCTAAISLYQTQRCG